MKAVLEYGLVEMDQSTLNMETYTPNFCTVEWLNDPLINK